MKTKAGNQPPLKSRQPRAKKKATQDFVAELQKAINKVDWGQVELPRVW